MYADVLLALSTPVIIALYSFAGVVVTTAGVIGTALIARESKKQNKAATSVVTDFQTAWEDRGALVDGYKEDISHLRHRLKLVEAREQQCLDALQLLTTRFAVLEAQLKGRQEGRIERRRKPRD